MRILFVSRAFPPVIGGIEQQNQALAEWLSRAASVTLVANRGGKRALPWFLPWAALRMCLGVRKYDVILLGDGVLAPLGALAKCFSRRLTVVTVLHGLDLTFVQQTSWLARVYRWINLPALRQLDGAICVSQQTRMVAMAIGLAPERLQVIPNGVDPDELRAPRDREALARLLGLELEGRLVIVRIGRFVRHKGVEWFIREVVPKLPPQLVLVAAGGVPARVSAGDANHFEACERAVRERGLEERVKLLPNTTRENIRLLLNASDMAVAPNIPVPGSMEGFGIAVIEAAACGLPIVAARLEGLQEAVRPDENGCLVESLDAEAFARVLTDWSVHPETRRAFGERAARVTREYFHWSVISARYLSALTAFTQHRALSPP